MSAVVAFVPDLMDRSKVAAAAPGARFVAAPGELAPAAREAGAGALVVVDLSRPGAVAALGALPPGVRSVGFGSHVDTELLDAARAAGCAEVLPRSRFFARLGDLLAEPGAEPEPEPEP